MSFTAERLTDFNIGVGVKDPAAESPTDRIYTKCATEDGRLGAGETKAYRCEAVGRYVIVQLNGQNYLTLCEVAILGSKEHSQLYRQCLKLF
jgi:hypothetical protein